MHCTAFIAQHALSQHALHSIHSPSMHCTAFVDSIASVLTWDVILIGLDPDPCGALKILLQKHIAPQLMHVV